MRHHVHPNDPRFPVWFQDRIITEPNTGCWLWMGSVDSYGYAQRGRGAHGHPIVHRRVLGLFEPLIEGLTIDHLCEVRCCVNPAHLEQVTAAVNTHRRQLRTLTCHRGHVLHAGNVQLKPRITNAGNPRIERACLACHAQRNRTYRAAMAVA